jgi:hypothetical protein
MKSFNDTNGNLTRDLPACSAVPQPTAPPRSTFKGGSLLLFLLLLLLLLLLLSAEIYFKSSEEVWNVIVKVERYMQKMNDFLFDDK